MHKIATLLVDDHAFVRQGVRALLAAEDDILIVGEAEDGQEAVEMTARLRPDVVVMDIAMPVLNGLEATRQILDASPATRVLVLSAHSDEEYVERVTALGAAGYVLKQSALQELATAIRTAFSGRTYVSPSIARRPGSGRKPPSPIPVPARLTARESQVLQRIVDGQSGSDTATALGISVKGVEKHRRSLMTKLGIHDAAGLTRYAVAVKERLHEG